MCACAGALAGKINGLTTPLQLWKADLSDLAWGNVAKAAKKAFLTDVQLACRPAAEPGEVTGSETSNSAPRGMLDAQAVQLQMQTAMLKCIGKNVKEVVKVDMCDRMNALGLFDLFPNTVRVECVLIAATACCDTSFAQVWPAMSAVRNLATMLKARSKLGEDHVVAFADFARMRLLLVNALSRFM